MANGILNREQAEKALYPAPGLPGGGPTTLAGLLGVADTP